MTEGLTDDRRAAWKAIAIFMALMLALSAVFDTLMAQRGGMSLLLVSGIMWSPGIAALLTCLILKRPIASLPWRWGEWRWNWLAWALPIGYGLVMYVPVWGLGLGGSGFPNAETLADFSSQIVSGETNIAAVVFCVVLMGTLGVVASAARALGEEIGWRGFLVWEMRKVMPFWAVGLLSGLIWAVWHWPGILFTDYNAGTGNFTLQMVLFTLSIVPMGIVYAYLAFRSNSLWPAVILHASHNLFLQRIFTPLTVEGEGTHMYIDEFGILLPIVSVVLAAYFYWRARRDGIA
ncbi:CPBP family intramembrane glutamic endopeptidase [Hyphomonas johnsonii]|uniref:Abortive infection protein n=1 Tax=Hyphomonas johnsonii MHS-2 TaxID=1280950 RepID=A0A059FUS7_9PROT|nr:CPBP family intramembrane glutamic endopeptidase [Hyphomonas johnsonii]KCZ94440.1 abortive infection protein [Hyphomonas johnsonii MHS-2]